MKSVIYFLITATLSGLLDATNFSESEKKKVVCYVGTWAAYRWGNGKFDVEKIDPSLCTHLIYSFFGLSENGEFKVLDSYLDLEEDYGRGNIKKFNELKLRNSKLKTMAAVGGWNEGSLKFSQMAKSNEKRHRFINSSIEFILKHNFDGIDIDWEYPGRRGGDSNTDKENFNVLLKELKTELDKYNLILSIAVSATASSAKISYDIPQLVKYVDFINLMAYDLRGSWDDNIGFNAPLYRGADDAIDNELNVHSCVQYWLNHGTPPHKIIMGIPLYGRNFALADSNQNKPGSDFWGPGEAGPYTREPGFMGYNELCEKFKLKPWNCKFDYDRGVPYCWNEVQWIGYDNVESVELKSKYILQNNLGGVMVWSLETDDFNGICGEKFVLMKSINRVLIFDPGNDSSEVTTVSNSETANIINNSTKTTANTSTATTSTAFTSSATSSENTVITTTPSSEANCAQNGIFRDMSDCSKYFICSNRRKFVFKCPQGLFFDENNLTCNYKYLVKCK